MNYPVNYGRCMSCGERLPPPSAPAHNCIGGVSFPITMWSEQAIRRIAYDVVREELERAGLGKDGGR